MKSTLAKFCGLVLLSMLVITGCRNEDNRIEETCFDEIRNQGELRVDCGGPNCEECPPSCDDRIQNQNEQSPVSLVNSNVLGIDCGGDNCEPCSTCEDGIRNAHWVRDNNLTEDDLGSDSVAQSINGILYRLVMEKGIDCGFPCPNFCEPTCEDGIQNGDEEGVDCGGSCEFPCPPPSCSDGIQNGTETGIDCGDAPEDFSACGPCPDPTCNDGIQNVHIEVDESFPNGYLVVVETGIDCDNNPFTMCPDCPLPTCFDGVQNGSETGIDCGGNCQTLCPEPNCSNGVMDGDETGVDCDDDPNTPCPPCWSCNDDIKNGPEFDVDCVDYAIGIYPDCPVCPSCHDLVQNPINEDDDLYELDVDCGGTTCEPCDMFLTVQSINGSSFRDQYSFNRLLAASGNTDTLELDHNQFPGLKIEKIQGGFGLSPDHLKVTAHQGFQTNNLGLIIRKVVMFIPYPDEIPGGTVDMYEWPDGPGFGECPVPFQFDEEEIPFISFQQLTAASNEINECFRSTVLDDENSTLTIDYLTGGSIEYDFEYLVKGGIDGGSMISLEDFISGESDTTTFSNLLFQFQYNEFQ